MDYTIHPYTHAPTHTHTPTPTHTHPHRRQNNKGHGNRNTLYKTGTHCTPIRLELCHIMHILCSHVCPPMGGRDTPTQNNNNNNNRQRY